MLSLNVNWQPLTAVCQQLSPHLQHWLGQTGSLTHELKKRSTQFAVNVLAEQTFTLNAQQQAQLNCSQSEALGREVLLYCDEKPMVYAQSWIPLTQEDSLNLTALGTKPLGEVIFQDAQLQRFALEVADFTNHAPMAHLCQSLALPNEPLWGRRSLFALSQQNIMVCEVFLAGAYPYQ